ncbi:MAG: endolytic transglycosylase MltG [Spirochaetales bacterium]|nr:endolytic transglycosylase MltG [Spirochaetales bacterium]
MKTIIKLVVLLVVIFCSGCISGFLLLNRASPEIPEKGTEFDIQQGDYASAVAARLKKEKLITSALFFKVMTRISGLDKRLQSGYLQIQPGEKTTDIIRNILNGKFSTVTFTIPEGYNFKEINRVLTDRNILTQKQIDDFISQPDWIVKIGLPAYCKTPEGFMFPETYTIRKGAGIAKIYHTMVDEFYSRMKQEIPDYEKFSPEQFYDRIILASIIEKEVRAPSEAAIVAGVFSNRLNQNMKLQSCATIQYILDKPKERLLEKDLFIESPYNTYLNEGLPPSPISNPGINALKAAFNPTKSDYLYFVVKDPAKGTHQFSKTYEEHLKAQSRYKSIKGFY